MEPEITKSLSRVVLMALQHCCAKRLATYSRDDLNDMFFNEVGTEMVNLFEERMSDWKAKAPSKLRAPANADGEQAVRYRGRSH